jgi:hypothetical protein
MSKDILGKCAKCQKDVTIDDEVDENMHSCNGCGTMYHDECLGGEFGYCSRCGVNYCQTCEDKDETCPRCGKTLKELS